MELTSSTTDTLMLEALKKKKIMKAPNLLFMWKDTIHHCITLNTPIQ